MLKTYNRAIRVNKMSSRIQHDKPVHSKSQYIDRDRLKKMLPKGSSHEVTDEVIDMITRMEECTGLEQAYLEEQLMMNINVFRDGKVDVVDYVNAIKYCALKQNMSNRKAWEITFPERLKRLYEKIADNDRKKAEGKNYVEVNIDSHVSNYNKTELVTKISAQLMVPAYIQYAPMYHAAIKKQFDLMNGRASPTPDGELMVVSPKVQQEASKCLIEMLKMPEDNTLELKIGMSDSAMEMQKNLADSISRMAEAQMLQFKSGKSLGEVQKLHINISDAEVVE